ncbi:MAG: Clp protease/crotonase-like domain-containing protein [Planctomycetota bacterium]|jgi:hypothetical protein
MLCRVLLAAVWLIGVSSLAGADVVVLKSGKFHVGEVQDRTSRTLVFRTKVDGKWTDVTFPLSDVKDVFEDPGNQADQPVRSVAEPPVPTLSLSPDDPPADPPARVSGPAVAVVPLHGQVGGLTDGSVAETFDVELLERALDRAAEDGVDAVVLDIESPGGYLAEMEAICHLLVERSDTQRIVAYTGDALSAAAVIALSCRELVVQPDSRIGAAVMVQNSPDGLSAVDAKLASPHLALQRQFMLASGRPHELLEAMSIQEKQLWWSAGEGFTNDQARAARDPEATQVDGVTTVLTMLAEDAVRWGVALGVASSYEELPARLGLEGETVVIDYRDLVELYVEQTDQRVVAVLGEFRVYFQSLGALHQLIGELQEAGDDEIRGLLVQSRRLAGRARGAARSIRREDGRILARRTNIPEAIVDELEADEQTLSRIQPLVQQNNTASLEQARQSVAKLLDRWRALMTF